MDRPKQVITMSTILLIMLLSLSWNIDSQLSPLDKDVEYNFLPDKMLEYMPLFLMNNTTNPCDRDLN